ncbi:unnamed protein product [Caenorhabditis nigoni]
MKSTVYKFPDGSCTTTTSMTTSSTTPTESTGVKANTCDAPKSSNCKMDRSLGDTLWLGCALFVIHIRKGATGGEVSPSFHILPLIPLEDLCEEGRMPEVVGVELKARDARRAKRILGLREVITTGIENYETIIVLMVKKKFRSLDIFLAFYDNSPDQLLSTIPPYTTNTHLAMKHGFEKGLKYALIGSVEDKDRLKGKTLDWFLNNMQQLNIEGS